MPAKRKAPTKLQESLALISDPHLYRYFDHLIAHSDGRGTPGDLAAFILDVEARIYGNRKQVEAINRVPETWQMKRRVVRRVSGRELPATAPNADAVRKRRSAWFPPLHAKDPAEVPANLASLVDLATKLGVKRATKLGQYQPGVARNFADPSPRHTVCMDGTWIKPHSRARVATGPDGEVHLLGSRAASKDSVRQQRVVQDWEKHNRKVIGVNHVVGITRTKYGRVFLGVERALDWEGKGAVRLTERIITHTGGNLHSLTYDKGLHDWPVEWLAAKYGVQVVVPAQAARAEATLDEQLDRMLAEQDLRLDSIDAAQTLRRTGHEPRSGKGAKGGLKRKADGSLKITAPSKDILEAVTHQRQAARHHLDGLIAKVDKGLPTGHGLPLGTSHYVSSRKRLVTVRSEHAHYRDLQHTVGEGLCTHSIHVDDGAFWEAEWTAGQRVKTQRVACLDAKPVVNSDAGMHHIVATHQLICYGTGEILEFDTDFEPRPLRRRATDEERKRRSPEQKALALMQPIARCDATFRRSYGLRNDIESWFWDLKNRLLPDKRAASLHLDHQLLDVLYAGIVTNALALRTYRYEH